MPENGEDALELPEDEVIERYEGGESVECIANHLRKQGIQATTTSVDQVLNRYRIIRHAEPGEVPRGASLGFSATKPMQACAEGTGDELVAEITHRYRDQRESLTAILKHLDLKHGVILSYSRLFEVLNKGAVLRCTDKPNKSEACREAILGRESELASRILAGELVKHIADELKVDHIRLSTELKNGGYLPSTHLGRLPKKGR